MVANIRVIDNKTGRIIYLTTYEYEDLFLTETFTFDELYEIRQSKELACSE